MPFKGALGGVAISLVVSLIAGCGSSGSSSNSEDPAKVTDGWKMSLNFSVVEEAADGGMVFNRLVAGADQSASDQFDNASDIRALLRGPLQAYFVHEGEPGYEMGGSQLWQDIRSATLPAYWMVEVKILEDRPVLLQWDLPEGEVSCQTNQFHLSDVEGLMEPVDLCTSSLLSYQGGGEAKTFVLRVS